MKHSLIITPKLDTGIVPQVSEQNGCVVVSTQDVSAHVDKQTGYVTFYDRNGHQITAEQTK
ncbi:MAG: hypothetical protein VZR53_19100, partial [Prevotella sp.]|nr:hypothetical protein [Prevotella sp.]